MIKEKYFGACNTRRGFVSFFEDVFFGEDVRSRYVIKGGPGTGKSTFLSAVAQAADRVGYGVETIYCSSDVRSLDGVVIEELGVCLLDGTSPHAYDCRYPGAVDHLIDFTAFWNEAYLQKNKERVVELFGENALGFRKAYALLGGAGRFADGVRAASAPLYDTARIEKAASRIAAGQRRTGRAVKTRLASSISSAGEVSMPDFCADASEVYFVDDPFSFAPTFIAAVARHAEARMTLCPSPFDPDLPEALYFPDTGTLVTSVPALFAGKKPHVVRSSRFFPAPGEPCRFEKKIVKSLVREAVSCLAGAKAAHDELEQIYARAMDFEAKEAFTKRFIRSLLQNAGPRP